MYNKFNKNQANYIKERFSHLIGQPLDNELTITHLWIIPSDQDWGDIVRQYQFENTTTQYISDKYGKGQNLYVLVLSDNLVRSQGPLVHQDISKFLPRNELDEILTIQEA